MARFRMDKRRLGALVLIIVASVFLIFGHLFNVKRVYQSDRGFVFGTTYSIVYANPKQIDMRVPISNALQEVNATLSMFNPNSLISQINRGEEVLPDPLFMRLWSCATEISGASGGAFDMSVAPLVDLWGFGLEKRKEVTSEQVDSVMEYIGWALINIEEEFVYMPQGMRLDASAIAKGLACDLVADTLAKYGCTDWCVEIGGEVAVKGLNEERAKWRIGINRPVEDSLSIVNEIYDIVHLSNGAMATSGNYRNYYELDGRKVSHTINPNTGYPVYHSLLSATIVASDCMSADAWATACMVGGLERSKEWIENSDDIEGYLIYDSNGKMMMWHSDGFPLE